MKKIIITLLIASSLFVSCDNIDTANVSQITQYPILTLNGDETIFVPLGSPYVDPGVVAMEGDNVISTTSTAIGDYRGAKTIDTNIMDQYTQTYTAVNKDGFSATISRTVIVYQTGDLVNSIEGVYTSTVKRNGSLLPASQGSSVDMEYVYIWKNANGTYQVSDAIGGWYSIGRNYGLGYITPGGTINATSIPSNAFTYPGNPQTNTGFGGTNNIVDLNVDPTTKTIVLSSASVFPGNPPSNYAFVSTLTQVQL